MLPFKSRKVLTMKINPWNLEVSKDEGSKQTAVYSMYCLQIKLQLLCYCKSHNNLELKIS